MGIFEITIIKLLSQDKYIFNIWLFIYCHIDCISFLFPINIRYLLKHKQVKIKMLMIIVIDQLVDVQRTLRRSIAPQLKITLTLEVLSELIMTTQNCWLMPSRRSLQTKTKFEKAATITRCLQHCFLVLKPNQNPVVMLMSVQLIVQT